MSTGRSFFLTLACTALLAGLSACAGGPRPQLEPEAQEFLSKYTVLMTAQERKIWRGLQNSAERSNFIEQFWASRDPNPLNQENLFKLEMERRVEYSENYFREPGNPGWNTDRGRMLILLGFPDYVQQDTMRSDPRIHGSIYWFYDRHYLQILFVDRDGSGRFQLATYDTQLAIAQETVRSEHLQQKGLQVEQLRFVLSESSPGKLLLAVHPADLMFKQTGDELTCRLRLELSYQDEAGQAQKIELDREITLNKEFLTDRGNQVELELELELPAGRNNLSLQLTDLLSGRSRSRDFRLRIR